ATEELLEGGATIASLRERRKQRNALLRQLDRLARPALDRALGDVDGASNALGRRVALGREIRARADAPDDVGRPREAEPSDERLLGGVVIAEPRERLRLREPCARGLAMEARAGVEALRDDRALPRALEPTRCPTRGREGELGAAEGRIPARGRRRLARRNRD